MDLAREWAKGVEYLVEERGREGWGESQVGGRERTRGKGWEGFARETRTRTGTSLGSIGIDIRSADLG